MKTRRLTRPDLDRLTAWPGYPFPYQGFDFSFRAMLAEDLDALFAERQADPARISLGVDLSALRCVAYLALLDIDWETRQAGNLALRVHPDCCDRGIGTDVLRAALRWVFDAGMLSVDLDVAATNPRAIRCYEKAGFAPVCELWRPAPDLANVSLSLSEYSFLRDHVRSDCIPPELRFVMMRAGRTER